MHPQDIVARPLAYLCLGIMSLVACATREAHAIQVKLDYSFDQSQGNFFGTNAIARATLEKAASDIGQLLTSSLEPIEMSANGVVAQFGQTSITAEWDWVIIDPTNGSTVLRPITHLDSDQVSIFVGMRPFNDATQPNGGNGLLGIGGPATTSINLSFEGFANERDATLDLAMQQSMEILDRTGGPVINELALDELLGPGSPSYVVASSSAVGSLALDNDTNNDGTVDSAAQLAAFWHLDASTPVATNKNDLYSVALHEMLHALGFGTASIWPTRVDGLNWQGDEVIRWQGSGHQLISDDGSHVNPNAVSTTWRTQETQEPAMTPQLVTGQRKEITQLDAAFLRDIGWTTKTSPILGDFDGDGTLDTDDLEQLSQAQREHDPQFDITGDRQTDQLDRTYWITELKKTWYGDANLDGQFDTTDLVSIFQAGRFENAEAATWSSGDWDGDQQFSTSDLVVAFQDGGFERGPRRAITAVPESSTYGMLSLGVLVLMRWRRHTSGDATCHDDCVIRGLSDDVACPGTAS